MLSDNPIKTIEKEAFRLPDPILKWNFHTNLKKNPWGLCWVGILRNDFTFWIAKACDVFYKLRLISCTEMTLLRACDLIKDGLNSQVFSL